jgi:2-dehydro-3-deoxygluconokinase
MSTPAAPAVVCFGETMALVAPDPPQPLVTALSLVLAHAGAESNVALGLARAGTSAAWCSRVGDDPFGRRILADLVDHGVDVSPVRMIPGARTGVMFKDPAPTGTAVRYYRDGSAAAGMDASDAARALEVGAEILHLTGITPALSDSCASAIDAAIGGARQREIHLSFDVNYRAALWPGVDEAADTLVALAQRCDTVFVGLDEALALWGTATAQQVRDVLDAPPVLVVKDGAAAATAFAGGLAQVISPPAVTVVEPVGAGDAFAAGWWHARLGGADAPAALESGHRFAAAVLASATDHPVRGRLVG